MKIHGKVYLIIILTALFPPLMNAQWTGDPTENTVISDINGTQIMPMIFNGYFSDTYISWYSNTNDLEYDVYLQRLDSDGYKLWDENGLLISSHPTLSSVTKYGLATDPDGYAILALQDQRTGSSNVFAYKISQDGNFIWGNDGVQITNTTDFNAWPQVIIAPGNEYVFIYGIEPTDQSTPSSIGLQKLTKNGDPLWGDGVFLESTDYLMLPQVLVSEDHSIIVSWLSVDDPHDPGAEHYLHVYCQKLSQDGQPMWQAPVRVDAGDIMLFNSLSTLPLLTNDGADGAYISWQSFYNAEPTILVNRIDSSGHLLWSPDGVRVSTKAGSQQMEPSVTYKPEADRFFVFWRDYKYDPVGLTDCWGVSGQMFSPSGQRLWSDTAEMVVPYMCSEDSTYLDVTVKNAGLSKICVFYEKEYFNTNGSDTIYSADYYASLLKPDGSFSWPQQIITFANSNSDKGSLAVNELMNDQWITVWADNRQDPGNPANTGIYAQNVYLDGSMGMVSVPENTATGEMGLSCYPNPGQDFTNVGYELKSSASVSLKLTDLQGRLVKDIALGEQASGAHKYILPIGDLPSGIYFLELNTGKESEYVKVLKSK